ncbi:Uu.00g015430.m01.CDS01 [Anthostomella pinea]|uniref:Uu.00g015430.m01.CDS01 n=1 Tax=Anthostomella pinea TaxID=933095 RepID=A0AAI8VZ63_9PEZI|nr:Uu.00g015430.m01.CDS01 [Anthostomella pinea]
MVSDEELELVGDHHDGLASAEEVPRPSITRAQAFNLYLSHAFSTWNARGYEFAAILFTAGAYPDTLVAAALRMIIVYFAMILFSSSVGQWVEQSPNRLRTLLSTIVCNRGSVVVGSFFWLLILSQENLVGDETAFVLPRNDVLKGIGFAIAVTLGIVERLSASGNLISMERDWVVTVAAPSGRPYDLTHLNAVIRRIDLVCKLISPIIISIIISALGSVRVGVVFTGLTSLLSIPIEVFSATRVWKSNALLQVPRPVPPPKSQPVHTRGAPSWISRTRQYFRGLEMYFSTSVWLPSVALALCHYNMLTWRATFVTYLINVGYSLNTITVARAIGSVFEISSTVITPRGIVYLGKAGYKGIPSADENDESGVGLIAGTPEGNHDAQTLIGLQRLGLWGLTWQTINTVPVVLALWAISAQTGKPESVASPASRPEAESSSPDLGWSIIMFSFLAFSRLGVWIFDLTTQQLTQTMVPENQRSSFAGVENSVVNVFELLGAGSAVAFPHTEQYRWLALVSLLTVMIAWAMLAVWYTTQLLWVNQIHFIAAGCPSLGFHLHLIRSLYSLSSTYHLAEPDRPTFFCALPPGNLSAVDLSTIDLSTIDLFTVSTISTSLAPFSVYSARNAHGSLVNASVGSLVAGNMSPPPKPAKKHCFARGYYEDRTQLLEASQDEDTDFYEMGSGDDGAIIEDGASVTENDWVGFDEFPFSCDNQESDGENAVVVQQLAATMTSNMKDTDIHHDDLVYTYAKMPVVPDNSRRSSNTAYDMILNSTDDTDCSSDKWSILSADTDDAVVIDSDHDGGLEGKPFGSRGDAENQSLVPDLDRVNAKLCVEVVGARDTTPLARHPRVHPRYAARYGMDPFWRVDDGSTAPDTLVSA